MTPILSDSDFHILLDDLERSRRGYRKVRKGVKKRIRHHMRELNLYTVEEYLSHIHSSPLEMQRCQQYLGVTISRFFRDRGLWQLLEEEILDLLATDFASRIAVWSAGCGCGEEPYSFALLLAERATPLAVECLGTDLNRVNLERAIRGCYPPSSLRELPETLTQKYFCFDQHENEYRIDPSLQWLEWRKHDLFDPPPGREYHLIFLRNSLLTYHVKAVQVEVLAPIVQSLAPGGFLLIGSHEEIPEPLTNRLQQFKLSYVWRKG